MASRAPSRPRVSKHCLASFLAVKVQQGNSFKKARCHTCLSQRTPQRFLYMLPYLFEFQVAPNWLELLTNLNRFINLLATAYRKTPWRLSRKVFVNSSTMAAHKSTLLSHPNLASPRKSFHALPQIIIVLASPSSSPVRMQKLFRTATLQVRAPQLRVAPPHLATHRPADHHPIAMSLPHHHRQPRNAHLPTSLFHQCTTKL